MTRAGRIVELRRYRIPAGQRAINAQRIDGRVAVIDVPIDHADRVYLIERHIPSQAELQGIVDEYAQHSQAIGAPAVLALKLSANELPTRPRSNRSMNVEHPWGALK